MMLPEWTRQFAAGGSGPIEVHTLDAWIDLSDVRDVVRAYRLLVERGRRGGVYNVGSGVNRRCGEVFELLRDMADPGRQVIQLHPGRKQAPIAETTGVARDTGWRATIPLETTLSDTLAWWRQHGKGGNPRHAGG
jgi:GDP-4-dehydro-6-deoxy-D-mannose reductase